LKTEKKGKKKKKKRFIRYPQLEHHNEVHFIKIFSSFYVFLLLS